MPFKSLVWLQDFKLHLTSLKKVIDFKYTAENMENGYKVILDKYFNNN